MTTEEKIQIILANSATCRWKLEQILARVSDPSAPLAGGVAEWLRRIGVDDARIEPALDEALSAEARAARFRSFMDRYRLNNQATAALLGCSVPLVAAYRSGRREIPIRRLLDLQRIVEAIDVARNN